MIKKAFFKYGRFSAVCEKNTFSSIVKSVIKDIEQLDLIVKSKKNEEKEKKRRPIIREIEMKGGDVYLPKEYKDTAQRTLAFYHINQDMQKISNTNLSKEDQELFINRIKCFIVRCSYEYLKNNDANYESTSREIKADLEALQEAFIK